MWRPVVHRKRVAGVQQAACHSTAHSAETDETDAWIRRAGRFRHTATNSNGRTMPWGRRLGPGPVVMGDRSARSPSALTHNNVYCQADRIRYTCAASVAGSVKQKLAPR